jgi:glycosyltransferase involved in cell wall biosynthesis
MSAISVIVGTYNHLPYLKLCLFSLERQTFKDFEVIIADDGSEPEVGNWLKSYRPHFSIKHLWQEDRGFRKCKILNKAILASNTEYLVFIDADCILSKNFLEEHWRHREKGVFLGGRRILITKEYAKKVNTRMIQKGYFDGMVLSGIYHVISGHFSYYEEAFKLLHYLRKNSRFSLMGCNFSIHKSDILLVNGFDEDYEHRGGGEDTDIAMRLRIAGCNMKSVRYRAIQFHVGHGITESKSRSEKMFLEKKSGLKNKDDILNIKSSLKDIKRISKNNIP